MNNIYNIGLLIFDLDGTICQSAQAALLVMKKAFIEMGVKKSISEEDVKKNLGEPTERFFTNLLGQEYSPLWKKLSEKYNPMIPEFVTLFPGVLKTLKSLKRIGYKLTVSSNCGTSYLKNIFSKLNIGQLFCYAECNGDNNLSKSEVAGKIMEMFSGSKAAVVGDKIHDIYAARENNALSVGALYGYAPDEAKMADITIKKFSDLLKIFK